MSSLLQTRGFSITALSGKHKAGTLCQMPLWTPISAHKAIRSVPLASSQTFHYSILKIFWVSVQFVSVCEQQTRTPVAGTGCTHNHRALSWAHSCQPGERSSLDPRAEGAAPPMWARILWLSPVLSQPCPGLCVQLYLCMAVPGRGQQSHPARDQSHMHPMGWGASVHITQGCNRNAGSVLPQVAEELTVPEEHWGRQHWSQSAQEQNEPGQGSFQTVADMGDWLWKLKSTIFCTCSGVSGHLPHGIFLPLGRHWNPALGLPMKS